MNVGSAMVIVGIFLAGMRKSVRKSSSGGGNA